MNGVWITLGPASIDIQEELFKRGVTGVRLTFSFGTPQLQLERARDVRGRADSVGRPCLVIADLPGEKVRIGEFDGPHSVDVRVGDELRITCGGSAHFAANAILPIPNEAFVASLTPGANLTIGDGAAVLEVVRVHPCAAAEARVVVAGTINHTRGITVQYGSFTPASLTDADRSHLEFVAAHDDFDAVALSFVSSADEVRTARTILDESGRSIPIIAKIESAAGVRNLDDICVEADGVMAARGDLALAQPWTELPAAVERIAATCARHGKPWILATQVAEGLERFAFLTRAEICDLAHWLQRGCGAVLLSYETVFGANALGAVACVRAVVDRWGEPSGSDLTRRRT